MDQPHFDLKLSQFGATTPAEKKEILDKRNANNTNRATKSAMMTFMEYLREKQLPSVVDLDMEPLSDILTDFYTNLHKTDGDNYKLQSIKCIRAGINRYMKAEKGVDIIANDKFVKVNEMFRGVDKQLRMSGLGSVKNTPVITEEDLSRIAQYFNHDIMNAPDSKKVQRCLIFTLFISFVTEAERTSMT